MRLSSLLDMEPTEFFENHFHKRPLHRAGCLPEDLLHSAWSIATELLSMHSMMTPGVFVMAVGGRPVQLPTIPYNESELELTYEGTDVNLRIRRNYYRPEAIAQAFSKGASAIVNGAQRFHERLRELVNITEDFTGQQAVCNVFMTSHKHQFFNTHADAHDLFIFQLAGIKHWSLHEYFNPELERNVNLDQHPDFRPGPVVAEVTVTPGDVLYVPWGRAHTVRSQEPSLHAAVAVNPLDPKHPLQGRLSRFEYQLPKLLGS